MNLEELSTQLENAVANLYILWLAHEEERFEHTMMSNALRATYDHLNNIAQAVAGIVASCPAEIIDKCVEVKK
ncbi:MAG: hypothetical protein IKA47_08205 [Oscillospiraceae bacterium]|nr:hypothetical protein [Oscillospiraceae bacterium]